MKWWVRGRLEDGKVDGMGGLGLDWLVVWMCGYLMVREGLRYCMGGCVGAGVDGDLSMGGLHTCLLYGWV